MSTIVATWCANTSSRSRRLVSHRNSMGTAWGSGARVGGRWGRQVGGSSIGTTRCGVGYSAREGSWIAPLAACHQPRFPTALDREPALSVSATTTTASPCTPTHLHVEPQDEAVGETLADADGRVAGPAAVGPVEASVVEPAAPHQGGKSDGRKWREVVGGHGYGQRSVMRGAFTHRVG